MTGTRRADFWFSIALTLLGGVIVIESWRMPRLENLGVEPMSAPGLTPGLLGVILTGLGLALLARSVRAGPAVEAPGDAAVPDEAAAGWRRFAMTLGLCLVFALALLGRLPFWLATSLFVFAFVAAFSAPRDFRTLAGAGVLALVTGVSVFLLFERVFLVRLP